MVPLLSWYGALYLVVILSFFSCIFLFWNVSQIKNPSYSIKIIFWIAFADFIQTIVEIVDAFVLYDYDVSFDNQPNLMLMVFTLIFPNFASLLWSSALSIFSYKTVSSPKFDHRKFYKICLISIFPLSLFFAGAPFLIGMIFGGNSDIANISYFVCLPFPINLALILSVACYCLQMSKLKSYPAEMLKVMNIKIEKLTWYPLS